jgi:V-type H+-transporting ATPase subunit a|eukprot:jgi/Chrpa1/17636/Chrysochromulina_OHIO_Genome00027681-RA
MVMLQVIVQADAASETVEELGELGTIMFCDLNEGATIFQRNFVQQMKDCDEVNRCLRFIGEQVAAAPHAGVGDHDADDEEGPPLVERLPASFATMKSMLQEVVADLGQLNSSQRQLTINYNHLVELSHVLQKCDDVFSQARHAESAVVPRALSAADLSAHHVDEDRVAGPAFVPSSSGSSSVGKLPHGSAVSRRTRPSLDDGSCSRRGCGSVSSVDDGFPTVLGGGIDLEDGLNRLHLSAGLMLSGEAQQRLGYIAGVIERAKLGPFERVVFRATRGNMYLRHADISQRVRDPFSGDLVYKSVFIIFFSGQRSLDRLTKLCDTFGANRYNYPPHAHQRTALLAEVQSRIDDLQKVSDHAALHRAQRLASLARQLPTWRRNALKQKAVYRVLNMWNYDLTRKCLIAEGWCPLSMCEDTQAAVRRGAARSGIHGAPSIVNVIDTDEKPPTHFRINKFTAAFQGIVDGYGVPRCGEINPAAFTIITYPFLFGVMFGDVGHGLILLVFALYLVTNERKFNQMSEEEIGDILGYPWHGRYVLLLMAAFSIYCGLIYNDTFGLMMDLFGSAYEPPVRGESRARSAPNAVYPFGLDPAWHHTSNELAFANSYKMKLSIILGILQMLLGLLCSLLNAIHSQSELDIWCEFVPQAMFMLAIFGYLVFAIVYKWLTDWVALAERPPSLISMLIAFFMQPGEVPNDAVLFPGQTTVQTCLLTVALIAVPWMLLAKPLLMRRKHQAASGYKQVGRTEADGSSRRLIDDSSDADGASDASDLNGKPAHGSHDFDFGEVMMHQLIHTIEYVLGAISNTASYLRLWALSLAHKQLSVVFYEMILRDQVLF